MTITAVEDRRINSTLVLLVGDEPARAALRPALIGAGMLVAEAVDVLQAAALYPRLEPNIVAAAAPLRAELSEWLPDGVTVIAAEDLPALTGTSPRTTREPVLTGAAARDALAEFAAIGEFTGATLSVLTFDVTGNIALATDVISEVLRDGDLIAEWQPGRIVIAFLDCPDAFLTSILDRVAVALSDVTPQATLLASGKATGAATPDDLIARAIA
jgi:hypothetical protein